MITNRYSIIIFFFLLSFSSITTGGITENIRVDIIDFGIYKKDKPLKIIPDSESATGYRSESLSYDAVVHDNETLHIPLEKGLTFGFRAKIIAKDTASSTPITVRIIYPRMVLPDGTSSTSYEYTILFESKPGMNNGGVLYTLSEDHEMVAGEWLFSILSNGRLLAQKNFIIE